MSRDQQQQIRFCTSADGTRLAVATVGEARRSSKRPPWLTHVEKDPHNLFTRHWVAEGKLKPHVGAVLPLDEFRTAMGLVRDRKAQGRVVLQVRSSVRNPIGTGLSSRLCS
jgi:NADPH:quinone reductase-like Zn-dependent oxidoreductase